MARRRDLDRPLDAPLERWELGEWQLWWVFGACLTCGALDHGGARCAEVQLQRVTQLQRELSRERAQRHQPPAAAAAAPPSPASAASAGPEGPTDMEQ